MSVPTQTSANGEEQTTTQQFQKATKINRVCV